MIGVSLSIMLLTISQIMIISIEGAVESSLRDRYGDYDIKMGYPTDQGTFSSKDRSTIQNIENVAKVYPILYPYTGEILLGNELAGKPIYIGVDSETLEVANLRLVNGRFPKSGEVLFFETYLKEKNLKIGQKVKLSFPPYSSKEVTISGALEKSENVSRIAVFQINWLQNVTHQKGNSDTVYIKIINSKQKMEVIDKLKTYFPRAQLDSRPYMDDERNNLSGIKPIVQGLTYISIIAGAFIVMSTIQISLRERHKDLATLRLIGAKPIQLAKMIVYESFIIGGFAIIIGTIAGLSLSELIRILINQLQIGVELKDLVIPISTLLLNGGLALIIILLTSLLPAYTASQLSALSAYRQQTSPEVHRGFYYFPYILVLVLLILASLFNHSVNGSNWLYAVIGLGFVLTIFWGIPSVLMLLIRPFNIILKLIYGGEGLLAGRNAVRQIKKSQLISGVLMMTIILGCVGSMVLQSILYQAEIDLKKEYPVSYTIKTLDASKGLDSSLSNAVNNIPKVTTVALTSPIFMTTLNLPKSNFNAMFVEYQGKKQVSTSLIGINTEEMNRMTPIKVIKGTADQSSLENGGILMTKELSDMFGYQLGDTVVMVPDEEMGKNELKHVVKLEVKGIVENIPVSPNTANFAFYTDSKFLVEQFQVKTIHNLYIQSHNEQGKQVKQRLQYILQNPDFSNATLFDRNKEMMKLQNQYWQRVIVLFVAILVMTCLVFLGLLNIMASSLQERRKELAMMRSLGAKPYQITRMILAEVGILTFVGGLVGIMGSIVLGYHLLVALDANEIVYPIKLYITCFLISPLIGMIGAIFPVVMFSRQEILSTIREE